MQVKKINQKLKKKEVNENIINKKQMKQQINNESIDLQNNYILSPKMNSGNKQCYFYKPLKRDYSYITKKSSDSKFITNKNSLKNNNNRKGILKKDKIKVRLNSIKRSKDKNLNPVKNNKKLEYEVNKIFPIDKNNKTLIFNYSYVNIKNNNNKNNTNIFNSIQKTFESRTNKFQKFKNQSYSNFFYNLNSRSFKSLSNLKDLINLNRNESDKKNSVNSNKSNSKTKFKQSINRIAFNKINNKRIIDMNDISPTSSERCMNKSCLARKKNNITNSISLKTLINVPNLKMINNNRNNNNTENSVFSSKYNYIQNTYQKKLVKRQKKKIDNNDLDNVSIKKNIKKPNNNFVEIVKKYEYENNNYISPKNIPSLNNSESSSLLNFKKKGDNENINNKNISSNVIKTKLYNKNLYNKKYFYNKEKDETKYQTEQNFISDNNCSTSISFYQNQKNKSINNKLVSAIKLDRKLKNIITSIDFKKTSENFRNNKNVILYEFDKDGKINCKIREMKNSVEKIVRGKTKSKEKKKNKYIEVSPPKNQAEANFSLYIKKNQCTVLRKFKNKKIIEFY